MSKLSIPTSLAEYEALVNSIQWHRANAISQVARAFAQEHVVRYKSAISFIELKHGCDRSKANEELFGAGLAADAGGQVHRSMFAIKSLFDSSVRETTALYLVNAFCWRYTNYANSGVINPYEPCVGVFMEGAAMIMKEDEQCRPTHLDLVHVVNNKWHEESICVYSY